MIQTKELTTKYEFAKLKHELLKWTVGIAFAQTALLVAAMAFLT